MADLKSSGLLAEACGAYGIDPKYVLKSREANGGITILTNGGSRVSYKPGDKVEKLRPEQVTGIPVKKPAKK